MSSLSTYDPVRDCKEGYVGGEGGHEDGQGGDEGPRDTHNPRNREELGKPKKSSSLNGRAIKRGGG